MAAPEDGALFGSSESENEDGFSMLPPPPPAPGGMYGSSDSEDDFAPGKQAKSPSHESLSDEPLAKVRVDSMVSTAPSLNDGDEAADRGLFDSDSEGSTAETPVARDVDVEVPLWDLEDSCNTVAAERRLGALLHSAELVPADEAFRAGVPEDAGPAGKAVKAWVLSLQVQPTIEPESLCERIRSYSAALSAAPAGQHEICVRVSDKVKRTSDSHKLLRRVMSHIVDLPVSAEEACQPPPCKKMKASNGASTSPCGLSSVSEMEAFLDDLCQERAELMAKDVTEHQEFRDRTIKVLQARTADAAEESRRLRERCASAQLLTSRDRWMLQHQDMLHTESESLLAWAKRVSEQWWSLPEPQRRGFQSHAQQDWVAHREVERAQDLDDWVDEVNVFLRSLDPCILCGSWSPWVEACRSRPCQSRVCVGCMPAGCCSAPCAEQWQNANRLSQPAETWSDFFGLA